jgi:probable rRNA maturation factor
MPTRSTRPTTRASVFGIQRSRPWRGAPSDRLLRRWARAAARGATEVTLRVVGAGEGRRLNRAFRGKDMPTNVLTFCYARRPWRGDIVLCHPVIAREARVQRKSVDAHYAHLVVHGMLHLRGLNHARAHEAARMERLERAILARLGFGDPYAVK